MKTIMEIAHGASEHACPYDTKSCGEAPNDHWDSCKIAQAAAECAVREVLSQIETTIAERFAHVQRTGSEPHALAMAVLVIQAKEIRKHFNLPEAP